MSARFSNSPSTLAPDASANGKALEYACLTELARRLAAHPATIIRLTDSPAGRTAQRRYDALAPAARKSYDAGAQAGIESVMRLERMLLQGTGRFTLVMQADAQGAAGDVRDIVVEHDTGWKLGILVKHNNDAAKHPRLSGDLDFARQWLGMSASAEYFAGVKSVFDELESYAATGSHWSAMGLRESEKAQRFYRPVLLALRNELRRRLTATPTAPVAFLRYMTGRSDFYKLIISIKKRRNELQAFNFDGELGRAATTTHAASAAPPPVVVPRLRLPTKLLGIDFKRDSLNTLIAQFDAGWSLSMRLHSASSRVERSLKLDVRLISVPAEMLKQTLVWRT
jgi:hypothetical protein